VDSAGNAYISGAATSTDFPVTAGAFQAKNRYGFNDGGLPQRPRHAFITKMNPTGTALVYSTYLGGSGGW